MKKTLLSLLFVLAASVVAENPLPDEKEKTWWEKREQRSDIYYPHNAHREVMEQGGDPCLLCHPFSKNEVIDTESLKTLNTIANEPLAAICHECHMTRQSASWRCDLCHSDPATAWPDSHDFDYRQHHGEDARLDEGECRICHIDLNFCADCHFRRDSSRHQGHALGYRTLHGIEARMNPGDCGRCHNPRYCADCHREMRR